MRMVVAPRSRAAVATRPYALSCSSSARSAAGCSWISVRKTEPRRSRPTGSGDDTVLASDAHALDLEVVVEHEQVGGEPDVEPPQIRRSEHPGRDRARGRDGQGQRDAEAVKVAHRLDHRQRAARQDVVEAAGDA